MESEDSRYGYYRLGRSSHISLGGCFWLSSRVAQLQGRGDGHLNGKDRFTKPREHVGGAWQQRSDRRVRDALASEC